MERAVAHYGSGWQYYYGKECWFIYRFLGDIKKDGLVAGSDKGTISSNNNDVASSQWLEDVLRIIFDNCYGTDIDKLYNIDNFLEYYTDEDQINVTNIFNYLPKELHKRLLQPNIPIVRTTNQVMNFHGHSDTLKDFDRILKAKKVFNLNAIRDFFLPPRIRDARYGLEVEQAIKLDTKGIS